MNLTHKNQHKPATIQRRNTPQTNQKPNKTQKQNPQINNQKQKPNRPNYQVKIPSKEVLNTQTPQISNTHQFKYSSKTKSIIHPNQQNLKLQNTQNHINPNNNRTEIKIRPQINKLQEHYTQTNKFPKLPF